MSRPPRAIQDEALTLLPGGFVLPKEPDAYFAARFWPLALELSLIEAAMAEMLAEVDPRVAVNLLAAYERVLGPDPCGRDQLALTDADRQLLAYQRWTSGGNICPGYFVAAAAALNVTLTITEFPLAECGGSVCGDELVPFAQHCAFLVSLPTSRTWDAICGEAECGDSLGGFTPNLMECVVREGAPLFTQPVINYTS